MSEFYRKEDVDNIISQMRDVAEDAFFAHGLDPDNAPQKLEGYGMAITGFEYRLNHLREEKTLKVI